MGRRGAGWTAAAASAKQWTALGVFLLLRRRVRRAAAQLASPVDRSTSEFDGEGERPVRRAGRWRRGGQLNADAGRTAGGLVQELVNFHSITRSCRAARPVNRALRSAAWRRGSSMDNTSETEAVEAASMTSDAGPSSECLMSRRSDDKSNVNRATTVRLHDRRGPRCLGGGVPSVSRPATPDEPNSAYTRVAAAHLTDCQCRMTCYTHLSGLPLSADRLPPTDERFRRPWRPPAAERTVAKSRDLLIARFDNASINLFTDKR